MYSFSRPTQQRFVKDAQILKGDTPYQSINSIPENRNITQYFQNLSHQTRIPYPVLMGYWMDQQQQNSSQTSYDNKMLYF